MEEILPAEHLFIGHTVCPGFANLARNFAWWPQTNFHVRGYDYFHEGLNYRYTPVELAPYDYVTVRVSAVERAAARGRGAPIALVYRNPLDQAASYFRYGQEHKDPAYNQLDGVPLAAVPFRDYLLRAALPSYARQFVSFQALAEMYPHQVRLFSYERLMADRVGTMGEILAHLAGARRDWSFLEDAVFLSRRGNMRAIEKAIGHSLDGTRSGAGSHMRPAIAHRSESDPDHRLRDEAVALLEAMGVHTGLFDWAIPAPAANAA